MGEIFFRAIANVFSSGSSRLSVIPKLRKLPDLIGVQRLLKCKDKEFGTLTKSKLERIVILPLILMSSASLATRCIAFDVCVCVMCDVCDVCVMCVCGVCVCVCVCVCVYDVCV